MSNREWRAARALSRFLYHSLDGNRLCSLGTRTGGEAAAGAAVGFEPAPSKRPSLPPFDWLFVSEAWARPLRTGLDRLCSQLDSECNVCLRI